MINAKAFFVKILFYFTFVFAVSLSFAQSSIPLQQPCSGDWYLPTHVSPNTDSIRSLGILQISIPKAKGDITYKQEASDLDKSFKRQSLPFSFFDEAFMVFSVDCINGQLVIYRLDPESAVFYNQKVEYQRKPSIR